MDPERNQHLGLGAHRESAYGRLLGARTLLIDHGGCALCGPNPSVVRAVPQARHNDAATDQGVTLRCSKVGSGPWGTSRSSTGLPPDNDGACRVPIHPEVWRKEVCCGIH